MTIAAAAAILAAAAVAFTGSSGASDPRGGVSPRISPPDSPAAASAPTAVTDLTRPYITGAFTKRRVEERFLRSKTDDAGHVSYLIGALKLAPPATPWVALVGGSNVRECLQRPADLSAALGKQTGVTVRTLVCGSTNQHFGETLAVVENLPPGPGVVVIAVNHTRFAYPAATLARQVQGTTLLMPSDSLWTFIADERGAAPANTIAPGIRGYWESWRRRNAELLAAGRRPWHEYLRHRYNAEHIWSRAKKRSRVTLWLDGRGAPGGGFDTSAALNTRALSAIADLVVARGYRLVLMEAPADAAVIGASFDRYRDVYRPACATIAESHGGLYIDPNSAAGLATADFRDLTHLVGAGRSKWCAALAAQLAPVVAETASPAPDRAP